MYRGFKVTKNTIEELLRNQEHYSNVYRNRTNPIKDRVRSKLEEYLAPGGKIDVESLQEEWFPIENYDVFLSHSHGDIDEIEALAGYLTQEKGLKVFVDSFIWDYYDKLLEKLNRKYNWNESNQTYNHSGAKWCCSNVTVILNSALKEVIDKSEVLFFYNTPNSLTHDYNNKDRTESPWIFSEIETSRIIRKNIPKRMMAICESAGSEFSKDYQEKLATFSYWINHSHLTEIDKHQFNKWMEEDNKRNLFSTSFLINEMRNIRSQDQLDKLYDIAGGEK